jgi:hypothetical protein
MLYEFKTRKCDNRDARHDKETCAQCHNKGGPAAPARRTPARACASKPRR